jgi:2'-5' RNA ligase
MQPRRAGAGTNSLIVMAKPDEKDATRIARAMEDIVADVGFGGRLVRSELLHFTLCPIGVYSDVPQPIVDTVRACGDAVSMRPFTVSLNMVKNYHRSNGSPLIVLCGDDGVLGIRMLHKTLKDALTQRLGPRRSLPFEPHMTLSYKAMEIPATVIEPINFTIREFVLVNSLLGRGRHDVLLRWRLGD